MTEMLRNDDGTTRLRDMRQPARRRRDPFGAPRRGGTTPQPRPELFDAEAEDREPELESAFWGRTSDWVKREHEHVDPEADTVASGIERPQFDGFDDVDAYNSIDDIEQAPSWSSRLGLHQIDPLITRTSMILLVAVLAIPIAWLNRDDNSAEASAVAPSSAPAVTAAPETSVDLPDPVVASSDVANPTNSGSASPSTQPVTTPAPETTVIAQTRASGTKVQSASATTTAPAPVCGSTYTVRAGDSWSLVADRASIRMSELLATNGASTSSMLYPDDEICLPPGAVVVIPTTVPRTTAPRSTTPATTTTTTTIVLPPEPTTADAQAIIREVWPDDLEDRALEIAHRESRFHANASNWCCVGLFQIHWNAHKGWLSSIGVTQKSQLYDARTNAQAAYALYQRNGWTPWNL